MLNVCCDGTSDGANGDTLDLCGAAASNDLIIKLVNYEADDFRCIFTVYLLTAAAHSSDSKM